MALGTLCVRTRHSFRKTGTLVLRRYSLKLKSVQSVDAYLDYCKFSGQLMDNALFRGTLYEFSAKDKLEANMNCYGMIRVGGASDNGLDLVGRWNLSQYNINTKKPKPRLILAHVNGERKINLESDIVALVQCKNHSKKIKAATIRELAGVYEYHVKTKLDTLRVFIFLVSPFPLTQQAQAQVDTSKIPILHVKLQPMTLGSSENAYNVDSWTEGSFGPVYMNPAACKLLDGLDVQRTLIMQVP